MLNCDGVYGVVLAGLYITLVYGVSHQPGTPPRQCGWTLRQWLIKDSLFLGGYHIHHWTLTLSLLPAALCYHMWETVAFLAIMTLHGLSYADALEF